MSKISTKWALSQIARKVFFPRNFLQLLGLMRGGPEFHRSKGDEQLELYSKILPGDYLHYGYFAQADKAPEDISLNDLFEAQDAYGRLLVDQVKDEQAKVLDIGCGLGGLLGLMQKRKLEALGLTPDEAQIKHIKDKYPEIPLFEGKFEEYPYEEHKGEYGSVITSESFQYLDFDHAFKAIHDLLKPNGRWILCDYFRRGEAFEKSGHLWEDFTKKYEEDGWKLIEEKDITKNVLPGLSFAHMWCERIILPLFHYAEKKFHRKRPAAHFVLEDVVNQVETSLTESFKVIDPETFSKEKRYMFVVLERA